MSTGAEPRPPVPEDNGAIATLWHQGWHDAHLGLVPEPLIAARTLASFEDRVAGYSAEMRVVGPLGRPLGFQMVKGSEVYQFFVAREARGTGVAARLMRDAEAQLAAAGQTAAWIACVVGNERAARFYEKEGWSCDREKRTSYDVESIAGPIAVTIWRFEKTFEPRRPE
ncbi:MAG: GNAT family N-acetyltransferase [Pseudomonadota bacterium]